MVNSIFSVGMIVNLIYSWILVISVWGIQRYYTSDPMVPKTAVEIGVVEVYQPSVADKVEGDFGPWLNSGEVVDKKVSSFLNVMLISDVGVVKYSSKYSSNKDGFELYHSERVVDLKVDGTGVIFHDDRHNKLYVNVGQVFMFEDDVRAYQFNSDGELLSTKAFKPEIMK